MNSQAERKPADRRQQTVEAAAQAFAMFGYKATTMELVAKIAGVGKGTIYTFFATKEDLFNEIIRQLIAEMKAMVETIIDHNRPFFDNLAEVLHGILTFRERQELFVKLSQEVRELGTPAAKDGLARLEDSVIAYLRREVDLAMDKGEIRRGDSSLIAFLMFKLYVALAAEWSLHHAPLTKEEIAEQFTVLLKDGLAAR